MLINNPIIGGDHEVFLRNKNTKEIISAEGIIEGTKYNPYNFDSSDKYACTSLDCVLAEYNIAPAKTPAEFYHGIEKALNYIKSRIPENLEIAAIPAARLNEKYLQTETAMTFGCEPDYNAWTESMNERPIPDGNLRSAGFHFTLGYDNPIEPINIMWIKAMDAFIGVPSVIQEPDNERKMLYGKAGAFRHTNFGVEYRSTSNYLLQDKKLIDWAFNNSLEAIKFINNDKFHLIEEEASNIINCINNKDERLAIRLIDKFNIKMAA